MDRLERQQFIREQREHAAREAKKAREELARRRAALPPSEDLPERWRREADAQERAFRADHTGMIYKPYNAPAAAPPAPDSECLSEFLVEVIGTIIAEERARFGAEIDGLKNRIAELEKRGSTDLIEATRKLGEKLDEVRRYTEAELHRSRSEPLDLPPLPRRERVN
jgi:hypothetical protein